MKSPDAEKQKPAFWAGSLNSGARTRNRTKDTGIFNPFETAYELLFSTFEKGLFGWIALQKTHILTNVLWLNRL